LFKNGKLSSAQNYDEWSLVIRPKRSWFDLRLFELLQYWDLIWLFVQRDFVAVYKQTILGPLWYLIQPLLTTLVFTVIFGNIAKLPTDGLPSFLFYLSGTVIWHYFSECLNKTSQTFINNANLFGKVYFPRLAVPVSILLSNLISFAIQFGLFLCFVAYFVLQGSEVKSNLWIFITPLLLLMMAGLGLVLESLCRPHHPLPRPSLSRNLWRPALDVRDAGHLPGFLRPREIPLPDPGHPLTPIVEAFRYAFLGAGTVNVIQLSYSFLFMLAVMMLGTLMFNRVEATFMDTV